MEPLEPPKKKTSRQSACCVYDFTFWPDKVTKEELIMKLNEHCKLWTFQLEKGNETGREHYQGRISLKVKARIPGVVKLLPYGHVSITSTENRDNNFYVLKSDTRIDGPWNEIADKPMYVPRDVRGRIPRGWQIKYVELCKIYDERTVNVLLDLLGNNGKSWVTRWLMVNKLAQLLPMCNDFKDIMRMVMDMPKSPCYIIDMPRAMSKDRLYQFWSGIEMIKNGYAYDDRYHFKQELFDPPQVWVIMNQEPDASLLSRDRWVIWEITEDKNDLKIRK